MCDGVNDGRVVGIISTFPAIIGNGPALNVSTTTGGAIETPREETHILLSMLGRVPLRVNLDGGPIAIGDRLAASSQPGFAMKATTTARTVGFALENYDGTGLGHILTYIEPELSFIGLEINALGELAALGATTTPDIAEGSFTSRFFSSLFIRLTQWFADATNGITQFFAGEVHTDKLCLGVTCVTEGEFKSLLTGSAAAGAPSSGVASEAPGPSASGEPSADEDSIASDDDSDVTATTSPAAANDNPQPQEAEHSSDGNEPAEPNGIGPAAEGVAVQEAVTDEAAITELESANDNPPPAEEVPATGTD